MGWAPLDQISCILYLAALKSDETCHLAPQGGNLTHCLSLERWKFDRLILPEHRKEQRQNRQ